MQSRPLSAGTPEFQAARGTDSRAANSLASIVHEALSGMAFGQVRIEVRDGQIILIERLERRRLICPANHR